MKLPCRWIATLMNGAVDMTNLELATNRVGSRYVHPTVRTK